MCASKEVLEVQLIALKYRAIETDGLSLEMQ